jgi:hypothetical protein
VKEKDVLGELEVDGVVIMKWFLLNVEWHSVDWISVAEDSFQCQLVFKDDGK